MILPVPVREIPRPRRQRIPMAVCILIGVVGLGAVLGIGVAVGGPSQSALPVVVPARVPVSHVNHGHDVRYLRHHLPVPAGARKVRATPQRRAYRAPGGVPRVDRFYRQQLRRLGLRWHAASDGHRGAGAGTVFSRQGVVGRLRVERVRGTHGALVRILVVFRS